MEPRDDERFLVVFLVDFLGERRDVVDARLVDFREVFLVVRFAMIRSLSMGILSGVRVEKGHAKRCSSLQRSIVWVPLGWEGLTKGGVSR